MPNKQSAIKALKQSKKRNLINRSRKSDVKSSIKNFIETLSGEESKEIVMKKFSEAQAKLRRAAGKGVIHLKTASRKIGRLANKINKKFNPK